MIACSEDFHCGDDFDAVLALFRSSGYGENISEVVGKITTDEEKDYHKCSLCVIVCIAIAYQKQ